jgi:hypothetical protein
MSSKEKYLAAKQAAQLANNSKEWSLKPNGLTITQLYRGDYHENKPKPANYAAHQAKLNNFEQSFCR